LGAIFYRMKIVRVAPMLYCSATTSGSGGSVALQGFWGRSITLDHTNNYTVVGVMPGETSFPEKSEFWLPEQVTAGDTHGMRGLSVIGGSNPALRRGWRKMK
jgi:hypothetical protein